MNRQEFDTQVNRLRSTYGDKPYPDERVKLLWQEVNSLSAEWFELTVSDAIMSQQYAPMVTHFASEAAKEREEIYRIEKAKNKSNAEEFMGTFEGEELSTICEAIKARIQGQFPDQDFESLIKVLTPTRSGFCSHCENTGIVIDDNGYAYKCRCHYGLKDIRKFPFKPIIEKFHKKKEWFDEFYKLNN